MNKKLELLAYAKFFTVTRESNTTFRIEMTDGDVAAEITYYLTGCYNSGADWLEIDIDKLNMLTKFCELMIEEAD